MAQKLVKFGQRVAVATPGLVFRVGSKGADLANKASPYLKNFWQNAKVEMAPPLPADIPAIKQGFSNLRQGLMKGKFLDVTVKEAAANTLIVAEVCFWFYVGEIIGRKSLIGYDV